MHEPAELHPTALPSGAEVRDSWIRERIRQESETFDQRKFQDRKWFNLRLALGVLSAVLIPLIGAACLAMIWNDRLPPETRAIAAGALLIDVTALCATVWKVALAPGTTDRLEPVTEVEDGLH